MRKYLFFFFTMMLICMGAKADEPQRYAGGDISMLPMYEQHNSAYKDAYGKKIDNLINWFISECGWNTFRVRIFVHPDKNDPSLVQDLAYVKELGKRIKEAGAFFMLDFHYSDSWVDALHIQAPAAWKGASDDVMADSIATYTRLTLDELIAAGAKPDLVQVGNEIMYGLCDIKVLPYNRSGINWDGYLGLLKAGCNAVREKCPEAKIIIHTDRPTNEGYNYFYYNKLVENGVDYDIIGLSYYPFWHGYLTEEGDRNANLVKAISSLATQFPEKEVHLVEMAYNFQNWPQEGVNYNTQNVWACSKTGQYNFVKDVVDALLPLKNATGINYWFPEEAGNGDDTDWNISKGTVQWTWLNRGFWDLKQSSSGHAINRTGQITDSKTAADVCAPYYMGKFVGFGPQGISTGTEDGSRSQSRKYIENGRLFIERNGIRYSVLGQVY